MSIGLEFLRGRSLIGLTILTFVLVVPVAVLTGFFAVEIFAGLRPLRSAAHVEAAAISAVIVIPAHDEEAVIQSTIRDAMREAGGAALVLVVADNCKDRTADVSRGAGASVLERSDPELRGKGFALAAARDHLRGNPPAVVII